MNDEDNIYNELFQTKQFQTKQCCTCREELPITDFYKDKSKPDGYKSVCIDCYKFHIQKRKESKEEVEEIKRIEKYRAKHSFPIRGHCYKTDTGDIVKIVNCKKARSFLFVVDFEPIVPKSDVTQYTVKIREFRKKWEECENPLLV